MKMNKMDKLTSAVVSDTLESMGYLQQMLPLYLKPNMTHAKVIGRARTMTLKKLADNDSPKEVYKGLYFLETLKENEVLIVANGFGDMAFFGGLMATLAKSRGIRGTIIDGCTRDFSETVEISYPVFSKNHYARDVKNKAIVDTI